MAGARISREKGWSGWLGRVFLEKKLSLDGWGAYFSRKGLVWMAGARVSRENGMFWLDGKHFSRETGLSGWRGRVFLGKSACLDDWVAYFSRKTLVWMAGARISRERQGLPRKDWPERGGQKEIARKGWPAGGGRKGMARKVCPDGEPERRAREDSQKSEPERSQGLITLYPFRVRGSFKLAKTK